MLKDVLVPESISTSLPGKTKNDILRSLVEILDKNGKVSDVEQAFQDVTAHEHCMSTGMENGIAIPHARTATVKDFVVAVGISKKKIDFECLDRKPARIFIMTLTPPDDNGTHLAFLSEISALLRQADVRKALLKARSPEDIIATLAGN